MKLSTFYILITFFTLQASDNYAQHTKITLTLDNVTVRELLDEIESTTEFQFVYKIEDVDLKRSISIDVRNEEITKILNDIFKNTKSTFNINKRRIYLISRKPPSSTKNLKVDNVSQMQQQLTITGIVTDEMGDPLPGTSIVEKGTSNGVTTDFDGNFLMNVADSNSILIVSYLGYSTQEVPLNGQTNLSISLKESAESLDEMVVVV